ncbi:MULTISPECIES: hypothetical protein [Bacillus cereus group]|uniref:GAD-related domain-containing protein n=2 Tax=Bacillus cytotoxicus TaxID=580165 RepID=A0AAX2CJC5_9BACI|nr:MULTISPECIES: hypothetical protein [Bacillus cereus group]ABS22840.1 hypothetical protein Bcer98_2606 [Bacillus cytotoxicus NVH 391-98]AWC29496.1 hypothetical protein CG483_014945 [Bacillus cytotoxicus]AWC33508.1 hypothetical protein CG482_014700 [Bacillus cytotoxicus]AWC37486.1 hypothetical protein CG481_014475 [Bacillus cytotoxicus]AWC41627.1 hypothetical protein CG480_014945 [Bacillus cytotoxicus]
MNRYIEILSKIDRVYAEKYKGYGELISVRELYEKVPSLSDDFWKWFFESGEIDKFKYTPVILPSWSGDYMYVRAGQVSMTHLIVEYS